MLAITQAINGAGIQLVPTFGAIQVVMLLGNAAFAGLATSLLSLARVMTAFYVGRMTDRRGRKAGLYLGLWLALVGALLIGTATLLGSFALFCAGALVFGSGVGGGGGGGGGGGRWGGRPPICTPPAAGPRG
ncbi:major facilitator superfamily protein [Meiothermus ruber H328]|nr:major facilitator superfamily protein [Meiothermus ruber H328]